MKLALDVGPLKPRPAGVGIYVRSLATALAAESGPGELALIGKRKDADGLPASVEAIDRARAPYPAWALLRAGSNARDAKADVLLMTDGLVPVVGRHRRTVVTVLDLTLAERPRDHRMRRYARIPFILAAPRLASEVIVPSRATADAVMRLSRTPSRKIHVIPLAARPGMRPPRRSQVMAATQAHDLEHSPYILVPGTVEPRKNPLGSLRAFELLAARPGTDPSLRLVFMGATGWGTGRFQSALRGSRFRDRVTMLGYVSDAELAPLMAGAVVVLYPSFAEGFGLPVLEAMACGALVVTSDRSSLPEVAGSAGLLVNPDRPAEIADALAAMLGLHAAERDVRSQAALVRAEAFSWGETARNVLLVCRGAANGSAF